MKALSKTTWKQLLLFGKYFSIFSDSSAHLSESLRLVTMKINHLCTKDAVIMVINKHTLVINWVYEASDSNMYLYYMLMGEGDF